METNNGKKFSFYLKGDKEKALMLIHGLTGTPNEMRYMAREINKAGYSVFCNILPKHCASLSELKDVRWQEIFQACADDLAGLRKEYRHIFVGGLSMGAVMAVHMAYHFPADISGIVCLAPTIFYDGWALPWTKIFLDTVWKVPYLRRRINIKESWPYGLKDEKLREGIANFYKSARAKTFSSKVLLFGSPFFPMANLYQLHLLNKVVKKEIAHVRCPVIILHALEDDMTSVRNAQFIFDNIGSKDKNMVLLENSYHMITIDMDRDRVAREVIQFLDTYPCA